MSETRATTLLNEQGDITIVWEKADDETMQEVIEKKMAEGVSFFIIEPRMGGLQAPRKTELANAADAMRQRALTVKDEDFAKFVGLGTVNVVKSSDKPVRTVRKTKSAKEAASSETVGVRPMKGG
jgi:hypothetical protein